MAPIMILIVTIMMSIATFTQLSTTASTTTRTDFKDYARSTRPPRVIRVRENAPIELVCHVSTTEKSVVVWEKNGKALFIHTKRFTANPRIHLLAPSPATSAPPQPPSLPRDATRRRRHRRTRTTWTLIVDFAQPQDRGRYCCLLLAANHKCGGSGSAPFNTFRIEVEKSDRPPVQRLQQETLQGLITVRIPQPIKEGLPFTLHCAFEYWGGDKNNGDDGEDNVRINVNWMRNGNKLVAVPDDQENAFSLPHTQTQLNTDTLTDTRPKTDSETHAEFQLVNSVRQTYSTERVWTCRPSASSRGSASITTSSRCKQLHSSKQQPEQQVSTVFEADLKFRRASLWPPGGLRTYQCQVSSTAWLVISDTFTLKIQPSHYHNLLRKRKGFLSSKVTPARYEPQNDVGKLDESILPNLIKKKSITLASRRNNAHVASIFTQILFVICYIHAL